MNISRTTCTRLHMLAYATMVASILVGCSTFGASAPNRAGELPANPKLFDGVTITMLMEELSETRYIQDLLPEFKAATGINVQFENVPYGEMYTKLIPSSLQARSRALMTRFTPTTIGPANLRAADG